MTFFKGKKTAWICALWRVLIVEQGANERWIRLFGERKKESKKPNLCHDLF